MGANYADFDRLEVFTRVTGFLVNDTPLRIGVGREAPLGSTVDTALLRIRFADGSSSPYIPGSSLKGVLRSLAESLLRAQGWSVHSPWEFEAMEEEAESGNYCPICGIFGSSRLASHVRVYDAYPEGEPVVFVKTGVGINRDFLGSQPNVLYTEEQVAPGVRWRFRTDIVNIRVFPEPADERGRLLRQLFRMLVDGLVQVGARRTIGYGVLRLVEGRYETFEYRNGALTKVSEGGVA